MLLFNTAFFLKQFQLCPLDTLSVRLMPFHYCQFYLFLSSSPPSFFLSYCLILQDAPDLYVPSAALELVISPRRPGSFYWIMVLETRSWSLVPGHLIVWGNIHVYTNLIHMSFYLSIMSIHPIYNVCLYLSCLSVYPSTYLVYPVYPSTISICICIKLTWVHIEVSTWNVLVTPCCFSIISLIHSENLTSNHWLTCSTPACMCRSFRTVKLYPSEKQIYPSEQCSRTVCFSLGSPLIFIF